MFKYAVKRVSKSWKLFSALLIASVLGTTFFTGINVSADVVSKQAASQAYSQAPVDFYLRTGFGQGASPSSEQLLNTVESLSHIEGVNGTEVLSKTTVYIGNSSTRTNIEGIQNDSLITRGMKLESGSEPLGANETYVWVGSGDLGTMNSIGSIITLNLSIHTGEPVRYMAWNLTVKGVVSLSDRGLTIIREQFYNYLSPYAYTMGGLPQNYYYPTENILLVSWEKTFRNMLDAVAKISQFDNSLQSTIFISVDRDNLINPYDVEGSLRTLYTLQARIENTASAVLGYVGSPLINALGMSQGQLMFLRFSFYIIMIPIFILAWYMGGTASAVSFNLRRREIGLLSTRGFASKSIARLFTTESILIGLLSGLIGFFLGLLITPIILGPAFPTGTKAFEYAYTVAGIPTFVATMIFGTFLAMFTVRRAAKKAANIKTIDALKEYVYVEESKKPRISRLVWLAFILGTYKMVSWIMGLNLFALMFSLPSNFIVYIVFGILMMVDSGLNVIGPFLFLYGSVKLLTQGSARFQRKIGSMGRKLFKEAGSLATKNVQRNPARNFTVAFIIALIVGYGVNVVAVSASNQDYTRRVVYADVGADVSATVMWSSNLTYITTAVSNIPGVLNATYQRTVYGSSSQSSMSIRAVDPVKWLQVGYYEKEWFRGASAEQAFRSMADDNFTIILDSGIAKYLSLKMNDSITVTFSTTTGEDKECPLRVVGLFGPEPTQTTQIYSYGYGYGNYYSQFGSYVPDKLFTEIHGYSTNDELLVRLNAGANLTHVVSEIQEVENVTSTRAAEIVLQSSYSDYFLTGSQNVQNVGIALAIVAGSLETAIIVLITLIERRREIALLSVRGMSFRQISSILLLELFSIAGFALILGTLVGLIMTLGTVNSATSFFSQLVTHRMVFPLDTTLLIVGMIVLIALSVIVPILVAAKRASSSIRATRG